MGINIVIISDIFGKTHALKTFSEYFPGAKVISPYANDLAFTDEENAYQYFSSTVGIEQYYQTIKQVVSPEQSYFFIAFSMGASALWQFLASNKVAQSSVAVGFYGSQI